MTEEITVIRWMAGTTHISHETQVEGNALVFGFRLNGGEFQATCRMVCGDPKDLAYVTSLANATTSTIRR